MYSIREATRDDLRLLPAIEQAAGMKYLETRHARFAHVPNTSANIDLAHERVWIVVADGSAVAFAIVREFPGALHIHELDVHPDHARRGLGRRLIAHVARVALSRGADQLTLTTFADVPWNGPYYQRLGFMRIAPENLNGHLVQILEEESARGFPMHYRIAMEMKLPNSTLAASVAD